MSASATPSVRRLRSTARAMLPCPEPESWLDVGTGAARFPEAAKEVFPYTAFDGLDTTTRVLDALAAERVDEAHLGRLTDSQVTTRLRARYDVVSLLGGRPLPADLRAALTLLRPGGHLLLETEEDPRPQLAAQGCEIVRTTRRSAHVPDRLTTPLTRHLPPKAAARLHPATRTLDHALALLLSGTRWAKTYRVIVRKPDGTEGARTAEPEVLAAQPAAVPFPGPPRPTPPYPPMPSFPPPPATPPTVPLAPPAAVPPAPSAP
ncbi:class I SAM-dependent methyltransferase [Streptomyces sp. NPDC047072]|uniref:class I SAM-dependent methyltransferase n=1 Tax=Streptomyces sp. NPDC047072 TaxID=3154809 RepID=UPI0033E4E40E